MNILLDTHILLWAIKGSNKLPEKEKSIILNNNNSMYFSVISLWEIEIKRLKNPTSLPFTAKKIYDYSLRSGYQLLELTDKNIYHLAELYRPENTPPHKDPFDRMLICQAISENMKFLTHDSLIKDYDCPNIIFAP